MKTRLNDMKIGSKLFASFGIIIILYVVTIIAAIGGIQNMAGTLERFYAKPHKVVVTSLTMRVSIQGIGRNLYGIAIGNEQAYDEYIQETEGYINAIDSGLKTLEKNFTSDEQLLADLEEKLSELKPVRKKTLDLLKEKKDAEALKYYQSDYEPKAREARAVLRRVGDAAAKNATNYLEYGEKIETRIIGLILILAAVILIITSVLWYLITKSILFPIKQIKKAAGEIADGKLEIELNYKSENEFGDLSENIRKTAEALNVYVSEIERVMTAIGAGKLNCKSQMQFKGDFIALNMAMERISEMLKSSMEQIGNSSEQVAGGAEQVSNGAQLLAQGASEQAGSIEELAASINDISDSVKTNADNAVNSSKLADNVGCMVLDSSEQMKELIQSITQIKKNSNEITGIVKEIEDIAFQTNILALNASVEAARAGEAGRGFSVVANEVRRLASKTADASKMTAELALKTTGTVDEGMTAASSTADSLKRVVEGTQEVNGMVDHISESCVQQADAIIQIRRSIESISEIVQGNSATSEESAAASEELSAQAQVLKNLVEQFDLE